MEAASLAARGSSSIDPLRTEVVGELDLDPRPAGAEAIEADPGVDPEFGSDVISLMLEVVAMVVPVILATGNSAVPPYIASALGVSTRLPMCWVSWEVPVAKVFSEPAPSKPEPVPLPSLGIRLNNVDRSNL